MRFFFQNDVISTYVQSPDTVALPMQSLVLILSILLILCLVVIGILIYKLRR